MLHKIKFTKMQSLGNDFMLVDARYNNIDYINPNIVKQLSCRNTGIGFDQLLILDKNNHKGNVFSYSILNADGSGAKQCINGIRAIAKYIFNKYNLQNAIIKNLSGKYSVIKSDTSYYQQRHCKNNAVDITNNTKRPKNSPLLH